jgi:hypothetical protein
MFRVKSPQDFGAAIMFMLFGIAGLYFGQEYAVGNAARMGPGYFPMLLSWGLILFGVAVGLRAITVSGPAIEKPVFRPIAFIVASIILFGVLIEWTGLGPTTFVVCLFAGMATMEAKWKEVVPLSLFMAVFCVIVFIYGLNQPMAAIGSN